ncbi:hypothetical protein BYT27DRAFT_6510839 [Phlegmacium glaucopus]|nr:hypothetical protein BYT27DRAFT_6510839 [Phlegmacium glaucopus]
MMLFKANVFAFVASYVLFVNGQAAPVIVNVGVEGSFYNSATISAQVNQTVIFQFAGDIHTVTQSTFEAPCTPLAGGFNSGLAGKGTNSSAPTPTWSLIVTNVSTPIWFFCEATRPTSHCTAGMVGVINPPSIDMYNQFVAAAKLVTGTPAPTISVALTGSGAFATQAPSATPLPVTSSALATTSTLSSTSSVVTSTPSPTPTATAVSSTNPHLGAIVGGSVGGIVALIGLIFMLWLFCLRKKKAPISPESDEFFRYNPVPARRPSQVFVEAKRAEDLHHNLSISSNTNTNNTVTTTPHFSPVRGPPAQTGPIILQPPNLHRQPSGHSDLLSSNSSTGNTLLEQQSAGHIDIRNLAQEVAAVLYQSPPLPHGHRKDSASQDLRGQQPMTVQNLNNNDNYSGISQVHHPPPNYRAATGPSPSPVLVPRGNF